jgi:hypothetical protein
MLPLRALILCFALLPAAALAQNRLTDLRSRFEHETDPVHKAKLMPQLSIAEFQEIDADFAAGKMPEALTLLHEYRDEVQICEKGLDAKGVDAERHPAGFKQLQISMRESMRQLDELLAGLTTDEQPPFLAVRKDLDQLDVHLIHELFPNQPVSGGAPAK